MTEYKGKMEPFAHQRDALARMNGKRVLRRANKPFLTNVRLHKLLYYNPRTGNLKWLTKRNGQRDTVGTIHKNKYIRIEVDGRVYAAHRLIWFYMKGYWPKKHIDHINKKSFDNRWSNLRLATRSQNLRNQKLHKNNTSGTAGVRRRVGWYGRITWAVYLADKYIGTFISKAEAVRIATSLRKDWHL